jgi:hypothetical protein
MKNILLVFLILIVSCTCWGQTVGFKLNINSPDSSTFFRTAFEDSSKFICLASRVSPITGSRSSQILVLNPAGQIVKSTYVEKSGFVTALQNGVALDSSYFFVGAMLNIQTGEVRFYGVFLSKQNLSIQKELFYNSEPQISTLNKFHINKFGGRKLQLYAYFSNPQRQVFIEISGDTMSRAVVPNYYRLNFAGYFKRVNSDDLIFKVSGKCVVFNSRFESTDSFRLDDFPLTDRTISGAYMSVATIGNAHYSADLVYIPTRSNQFGITQIHKFTYNGRYQSLKKFDIPSDDTTNGLALYRGLDITRDGNLFVGTTYQSALGQFGNGIFMLSKLDTNLNIIWQKKYADGTGDVLGSIFSTSDGGCLLSGWRYFTTGSGTFQSNAYLIKVNANGDITSETTIPLSTPTLKVFPNPAQAEIQVALPAEIETFDYRIYDFQGKLVQQENNVSSVQSINIQALATGSYVLQVWQKGRLLGVSQWMKH